ncbi:NADH dehydrogenase 1 beta subcomplex subunit 7 ndufb7 [Mactra antiquata]
MGQVADKFRQWSHEYKDPNQDHVRFRGSFFGRKEEVDIWSKPTFDPMLGFPNGRKERECGLTLDEMDAANIPQQHRGYCAGKYLNYMKCHRETPAWRKVVFKECQPVFHEYGHCMYEQSVMQAKEFERERRLRERQKRRIALGLEEAPEEAMAA